jgi:hypothetical protein
LDQLWIQGIIPLTLSGFSIRIGYSVIPDWFFEAEILVDRIGLPKTIGLVNSEDKKKEVD